MLIEFVKHEKKFIIEMWDRPTDDWEFVEPFAEHFYVNINNWCIETFGYHARTAYNRFEFKKEKDMTLFILKWSN